jgi:hypothetical protein
MRAPLRPHRQQLPSIYRLVCAASRGAEPSIRHDRDQANDTVNRLMNASVGFGDATAKARWRRAE